MAGSIIMAEGDHSDGHEEVLIQIILSIEVSVAIEIAVIVVAILLVEVAVAGHLDIAHFHGRFIDHQVFDRAYALASIQANIPTPEIGQIVEVEKSLVFGTEDSVGSIGAVVVGDDT